MTFDVDAFLASEDTPKPKSSGFDVDAFLAEPEPEQKKKEQMKQDPSFLQSIDNAARNNPVIQGLAEFQSGVNTSAIDIIDFFTTDQLNSILEISGSESRVPSLSSQFEGAPEVEGGFMEEGIAKDIVRASGQVAPGAVMAGGAIRQGAAMLPRTAQGESALIGTGREIAKGTTAAGDVGLGIASATGGEIAEQYGGAEGKLLGQILTPLAAGGVVAAGRAGVGAGKDAIQTLIAKTSQMSDDAASDMISETLVRSGMTAEDVVKKLTDLGSEGTLADVSEGFTRLLKAAVNKMPALEGRARKQFDARQRSKDARIKESLEGSTGTGTLTAKEEIKRLDETVGKDAGKLYDEARESTLKLSDNLQGMLDDTSSDLGKARAKAESRLANERVITGRETSQIDIIDATKRELDKDIAKAVRDGASDDVRQLTLLKKMMLKEADDTIPAYKAARETFGGKKELENAVDMGRDFLKLKKRDMEDYFKGLSDEELRMFKLGAKDAILDKVDSTQVNSDVIKQISGKGGDLEKLKMLFKGDEKAYLEFKKALDKESAFIFTRRQIQGQSSTDKQLIDSDEFEKATGFIEDLMSPATYLKWSGKVLSKLSKDKGSKAHKEAQEQIGDLLLEANMKPERILAILKRGNRAEIKNNIDKGLRRIKKERASTLKTTAPRATAASAVAVQEDQDFKYRESQGGYLPDLED